MIDQPLADRVTDLEIQLTHQLKLQEDLNGVVVDLSRQLDRQTRAIQRLIDEIKRLKEQPAPSNTSPEDERPPHY